MSDDEIQSLTKEAMEQLSVEEAKALLERFGIKVAKDSNLDGVPKHFDVTRERIREIEKKALRKLRGRDDDPEAA